jgi:hypothetical protein
MSNSTSTSGEFLLYQTEDGRTRVECRFIADTLWLTQALMAELFQVKVPTVNEHLKTLYADGVWVVGQTVTAGLKTLMTTTRALA